MNSIRKNSFFSFLGFVIPTAVMLIAYPVLVHHLGTEAFGVYILATSISGAMAFLDFGFSAATLKFVAEDIAKGNRKSAADIIVTSLIFYGSIGSFGALLIWIISPWLIMLFSIKDNLSVDAIWVFRLSSIQFAISFLTTVFISLFKGLQRFNFSTISLSLLSILSYGGSILGILFADFGLIEVVIVGLVTNLVVLAVSAIIGYFLCRNYEIDLFSASTTRQTFRRMFDFGLALAINSIAGYLHGQVQRIMVGIFLGPQYVTSFYIGVWGPAKVNSATLAISEPLFPKIASMNCSDGSAFRTLYLRYITIVSGVSFTALFPLFLFPEPIFKIWFGGHIPPYAPAIASIMSVGLFFNAIGQPAHHAVNGLGKPWINTFFTIVSPFLLYLTLLILYLSKNELDIFDFAWATSASLSIVSFGYIIFYEYYMVKQKNLTE